MELFVYLMNSFKQSSAVTKQKKTMHLHQKRKIKEKIHPWMDGWMQEWSKYILQLLSFPIFIPMYMYVPIYCHLVSYFQCITRNIIWRLETGYGTLSSVPLSRHRQSLYLYFIVILRSKISINNRLKMLLLLKLWIVYRVTMTQLHTSLHPYIWKQKTAHSLLLPLFKIDYRETERILSWLMICEINSMVKWTQRGHHRKLKHKMWQEWETWKR